MGRTIREYIPQHRDKKKLKSVLIPARPRQQ
jgi:hypothetical protein